LAAGAHLPSHGTALLSVRDRDKSGAVKLAKVLDDRGFELVATDGTAIALAEAGLHCRRVNKVHEGRPHIVDMIKNGEIDFICNTTEGKRTMRESQAIRAAAVNQKVTYYTTLAAAMATTMALDHIEGAEVYKLQDLHNETAA
jgi:carbamoyl-phosphate synthase large subunit